MARSHVEDVSKPTTGSINKAEGKVTGDIETDAERIVEKAAGEPRPVSNRAEHRGGVPLVVEKPSAVPADTSPPSRAPESNTQPTAAEEQVVPLHIEEAEVTRRSVERDVQVHLRTISREHLVDEPLTQERVEIERVTIGRPVDAAPPVREEGDTTVISVVEEVLVVERRLILKEEIRLHRVRATERHRETVTLREQEAVVERRDRGDRRARSIAEPAPIPKPQALKD